MKYTIRDVEDWGDKWQIVYDVTLDDETTTQSGHCFPKDTLEWRAAEYGIDPADTATLLDLVLAEPHLQPADWSGTHLRDAPDIATARRDHIARCAAAKLRVRLSSRGALAREGGPLEGIHTESPMDLEVIALKTEEVRRMRAEHAAPRTPDNRSRAERFRDQVGKTRRTREER